jgi:hypothetical protein
MAGTNLTRHIAQVFIWVSDTGTQSVARSDWLRPKHKLKEIRPKKHGVAQLGIGTDVGLVHPKKIPPDLDLRSVSRATRGNVDHSGHVSTPLYSKSHRCVRVRLQRSDGESSAALSPKVKFEQKTLPDKGSLLLHHRRSLKE